MVIVLSSDAPALYLTDPDDTHPRIDVLTREDLGSGTVWAVVTGTPAAEPKAPQVRAHATVLCEVRIPPNTTKGAP